MKIHSFKAKTVERELLEKKIDELQGRIEKLERGRSTADASFSDDPKSFVTEAMKNHLELRFKQLRDWIDNGFRKWGRIVGDNSKNIKMMSEVLQRHENQIYSLKYSLRPQSSSSGSPDFYDYQVKQAKNLREFMIGEHDDYALDEDEYFDDDRLEIVKKH